MEEVKLIFDTFLAMFVQFWGKLGAWGIFGSWLMFCIVLRQIAKLFNKLKG